MESITHILNSFEAISLKEMDSVKLLDRIDTKFTFRIEQLPIFLERMSPYYRILDVNTVRLNRYESLYFDTDRFLLFLQHHNGKLNRYKVRYRCYTDSALSYFEIKFKSNKNRTVKDRIKMGRIEHVITDDTGIFLTKKTNMKPDGFSPKLWVYFSRITFVNKTSKERLTIDVDLNYKNKTSSLSYPSLVIAEVKQKKACLSPFLSLMKEYHIRANTFSKYCLGIASVYENIKKNNFKFNLLSINKLCHD